MTTNNFCELTPKIMELSKKCSEAAMIDPELYGKYDVKRGLRDLNGKGVLVGLTEISDVCSTKIVDGKSVPASAIKLSAAGGYPVITYRCARVA